MPWPLPKLRLFVVLAAVATLLLTLAPATPAAATHGRFPETVRLPDGWLPEGITSGPGTTFYAGSRVNGAVYRGDLRTGKGSVFIQGDGGVAVGMKYEPARHRLWVAGGPTGAVTVYNARTGAQLGRWVVPGSGFLNDVTVTRKAVYVTDSQVQRLVVIPLGRGRSLPGASGATTLPLTGDISFVTGFNANGIRHLPGGRTLILVQGNLGKLFRVNAATGVTDEIEVTGGVLSGGDGLVLRGRILYVVRGQGDNNVAILRLRSHAASARIVGSITDDDLDLPTTGTIAAGRLWVVNARFTTPPTPTTRYDVVRLPLR